MDSPLSFRGGQSGWIFTCIYIFSSSFVKLSVLLFCLRAERPRTTWYRAACIATICFVVCYTLGIFFACVFACQPFRKAFDVRIIDGKCVNQAILNIATAIWNMATDFTVLLLAFHLVQWWRLSKLERWGLCGFLVMIFLYVLGSGFVILFSDVDDHFLQYHMHFGHQDRISLPTGPLRRHHMGNAHFGDLDVCFCGLRPWALLGCHLADRNYPVRICIYMC